MPKVKKMVVKGACFDPQPHSPNFFFKHTEIESYLEGFMCEVRKCSYHVLFMVFIKQ